MREPRAKLHRPVAALRRLQGLAGEIGGLAGNDRDPNQAAKLKSATDEAFAVALAALNGGPLPEPRDRSRAI